MAKKNKIHKQSLVKTNIKPKAISDSNYNELNSWKATILTLFPEMFPGVLGFSVVGQALKQGVWSLETINIRDHATDTHRSVDSTPFGGGPGMVMRPDIIEKALFSVGETNSLKETRPLIYLSPRGVPLSQSMVKQLAKSPGVILLCGRFEGVDERVIKKWNFQEISIGDFVLSGGEIAAQALIDSSVRLIPDVLGNSTSTNEESFSNGLLEYPQYTKPQTWNDEKTPDVLLSGNHKKISEWRHEKAKEITKRNRPDLWQKFKKKVNANR